MLSGVGLVVGGWWEDGMWVVGGWWQHDGRVVGAWWEGGLLVVGGWWDRGGRVVEALQYSCLENPRDGGAWWAAIYGVAQSQTRLKRLTKELMPLKCGAGEDS